MIKISSTNFRNTPQPEKIAALIQSALDRADPYPEVLRHFQETMDVLNWEDKRIPLKEFEHIYLLSIGKAAIAMAKACLDHFGERIESSLIIYKNPDPSFPIRNSARIKMIQGDHPIPGKNSLHAGKAVFDFVQDKGKHDLLLVMISGGGSAIHAKPVDGVTPDGLADLSKKLLASGATIQEMNVIRRHIDQIKGGGLLRFSNPARVYSLIVSDVIGNELSSIGSGITSTDSSTFGDAIHILQRYKLENSVHPSILKCLQQGQRGIIQETLKPGDQLMKLVHNEIIISNADSVSSSIQTARQMDWEVVPVKNPYNGEAKETGKQMAEHLIKMAKRNKMNSKPRVAVYGGEPTVHLDGKGKGGRNLELGLSAVNILDGIEKVALISFSTDGEDGPTDAAGVIVTGKTASLAKQKGLSAEAFLVQHDSYHFFEQAGGLIKTGPTGTNVNDLVYLIAY